MKRLIAGLGLVLASSTLLAGPAQATNATPGCITLSEYRAIHPTTWRRPGPYTRARVERIIGAHGVSTGGGAGGYQLSYTMCGSNGAQAEISYETAYFGGPILTWAYAKRWNADPRSPNGVTVAEFAAVGFWTGTWASLPDDSGPITGGPTKRQVDGWFDEVGVRYAGAWFIYDAERQAEWNRYGRTSNVHYAVWVRYSADGHLTRISASSDDD